jgi:tetratricopeptide (TPR) repeat protein
MHEDQRLRPLYDALLAVGNNFLQQGKFDKALVIFDGLIALEPNNRSASISYGEALLMANRVDKALSHLLLLTHQFDRDGRALILTAKACILLDKHDEARKFLTRVTANAPTMSADDVRIATVMLALLPT